MICTTREVEGDMSAALALFLTKQRRMCILVVMWIGHVCDTALWQNVGIITKIVTLRIWPMVLADKLQKDLEGL